jgi:hypothetical protein
MRYSVFLALVCAQLVLSQPTASAPKKDKFGGPPNNPVSSGVQVDREFNEELQLSEERWNVGWFKRAGSDFGIPNTHLLVYLHSERCVKKAINGSCLEYGDLKKSLFFPRVDRLSRLEINDSTPRFV